MTDWKQKKYEYALRIGYIVPDDPEFEHTFVGALLKKYPQNIRVIHEMKDALGQLPQWTDITDRLLRDLKDAFETDTSANTRRTYYACIKATLNAYSGEADFPSKKYAEILRVHGEPTQNVYLTEEEIRRIYDYSPQSEEERYVRKIFLISCYTGARHSDAETMTADNIDGDTLSYVSQKTKTECRLPAHIHLHELIADGTHIEINALNFNETLRGICRKCEITGKMKLFRRGGVELNHKYNFVASHTARRSFCTNLHLRGADLLSISKMAGHSSIEMTKRYIVGYKEHSKEIIEFFNT